MYKMKEYPSQFSQNESQYFRSNKKQNPFILASEECDTNQNPTFNV